jgi:hypothetical protein
MSSISVKSFKTIFRLIPLALPALVLPLLAICWQPAAGELPGAAFHTETISGDPKAWPGLPPKPEIVPERPRPDLPAATPAEIAGAFYRESRDTTGKHNAGFAKESDAAYVPNETAELANVDTMQLVGLIRDSGGIERRYFKP